jgi:uncharacterized phiE125 gp8 family phage protein
METTYKVVTQPTTEPLSLTEAKSHLRVLHNDEDDFIRGLISAAREFCETYQNRFYIETIADMYLQAVSACQTIQIPKPPTVSVESITVRYTDGTSAVIPSTEYEVHTENEPACIIFNRDANVDTDSTKELLQVNPYVVRFTGGYGTTPSDVPAMAKHAMKLIIGHYYENREDTLPGVMITAIPMGARRLLNLCLHTP